MTTDINTAAEPRIPLTRERVLQAAIQLADRDGAEALSMRKLGVELGVEAMSLYNHISNKDDLLDGVVDAIVGQIELVESGGEWKADLRSQILNARAVLSRHRWAPRVFESRSTMTPTMLGYFDSVAGLFLQGGVSVDLMHHAVHALGSRMLGFVQELYDDSEELDDSPEIRAMMEQMTQAYPNISAIVSQIEHDEGSIIGSGCDDDVEFVFALDLILDGIERHHAAA